MVNVEVDLTGYRDRVGSRIPEGRYRVIVDDCEMDQSSAGNTMINVWLRVLDGPVAGQTVLDRLVLTPKSLFRVVGFMQAIGIPTPHKRFTVDPDRQFRGRVLEVEVEDGEPYLGKTKSEVRGYFPVEGGQPVSADLDDVETAPPSTSTTVPEALPDPWGGLDEFTPGATSTVTASAPPTTPTTASVPTPSARVVSSNGVTVTAPDDIDLADLDI